MGIVRARIQLRTKEHINLDEKKKYESLKIALVSEPRVSQFVFLTFQDKEANTSKKERF